jgi:hypothetical protein
MEAIVCQAEAVKTAEIAADLQAPADAISTLTSTEMSFVGGGCLAVMFA